MWDDRNQGLTMTDYGCILFIGFLLYVGYVALRDDHHVVSAIEMRNAVLVVGPK